MKVFALRMVSVSTTPRWQPKLRSLVADALDRFECNGSFKIFLDWDNSERHPDDDGTCGFAWARPRELLCDEVKRFIWDMEDEGRLPRMPEYSGRESPMAVNLACCIRAAADVAAAPSAGVLGWNVGQLKATWKGRRLPKWVTEFFEGDLTTAPDDAPIWL
jgi:hypothetical protein